MLHSNTLVHFIRTTLTNVISKEQVTRVPALFWRGNDLDKEDVLTLLLHMTEKKLHRDPIIDKGLALDFELCMKERSFTRTTQSFSKDEGKENKNAFGPASKPLEDDALTQRS